jgi:hypothetical protein
MELPPALMPWGAYLELFPRELAHALGPLIQRLDLVIGPLRASTRQGEGDPDGFYGITRRGSYERLLISEWMLAEEYPEEFARRAVMGEHGFLELARRQPAGTRTSVALFDAGPNQLGAPRIAHLAALIVLARRAEAVGACFQWGVLQQSELGMEPPATLETQRHRGKAEGGAGGDKRKSAAYAANLHTSVTAHTISHLLQARSSREAESEDIAARREQVGSEIGADDLWIVGGRRLGSLSAVKGASLVQIDDSLEPQAHHLTAMVVDKGRTRPTATLELPEDATCVRLLRDPFFVRIPETYRAPERLAAPTSNLLFATGGSKLMARAGRDHLIVYPVPNSPHADPGKPKIYHTLIPRPILAAGRTGKGFVLVTTGQEPDLLHIGSVGAKSGKFRNLSLLVPPGIKVTSPDATDPLTPCFYFAGARADARWLILVKDCLLRPQIDEDSPAVEYAKVEMEPVLAAGSSSTGCMFVGQEASRWVLLFLPWNGPRQILREFSQVQNARLGYGGPFDLMAAVEEVPGQWMIWPLDSDFVLHPSSEDQVMGVVVLSGNGIAGIRNTNTEPGLIVLHKDRRKITVMGRNWTRAVPPASTPIVRITASLDGPEIAYLTVHGELVIYCLQREVILYRLETRLTL